MIVKNDCYSNQQITVYLLCGTDRRARRRIIKISHIGITDDCLFILKLFLLECYLIEVRGIKK